MQVAIDRKWCKGCGLCIDACKKGTLAFGTERSDRGYLMPAVTDINLCVGCMMCERICPDLCIAVTKE